MDAMRGDPTLFTRNDEVEAQWRIIDPILEAWEQDDDPARRTTRRARTGPRRPTGSSRPATAGGRSRCPKTAPEVPDAGAVWSAEDTAPGDIEEALRHLLQEQHARDGAHAPARVLNLVVVVDREWRGEIMNRLEQVGRYHASRTILCTVEPAPDDDRRVRRDDASRARRQPGELDLMRERVILEVGEKHLREARHDRRPARGDRPPDGRLVAARPSRGGRRAAAPGAGRADRLGERAGRRRRAPAREGAGRGRVRGGPRVAADARRGASAWRPRSTRRAGARSSRRIDAVTDPPPARLGRGRRALLRLARVAARLGARAR